jgi:hypothetical protein
MASAWTFGGRLRVNWDRAEWEVKSEECGRREDATDRQRILRPHSS